MADNTVTISFKAIDADKLEKAIKGLDDATKSLVRGQTKLVTEGRKVKNIQGKLSKSTEKQTQATRILGGTIAVLRSKMLLFNFAVGFAIRSMGKFVTQSSKVDSMKTAFNTLSGATEGAGIALNKLKSATNGTMSEFNLFQQANNAMILGVSKNSDEMAEMFDIAQRLGKALGKDTASSVESLITGIGRQSRLMLDNIGIVVKSKEAYEEYAKKLKTTAEKLTDAQKKQAFLEATMESARHKIAQLGQEEQNTQNKLDSLTASTANFSVAIGNTLTPAIGGLSVKTSSLLDDLTSLLNIFNHNQGSTLKYTTAVENSKEMIKKYSEELNLNVDTNLSLEKQLISLRDQAKLLDNDMIGRGFSWLSESLILDEAEEAYYKLNTSIKTLASTTRDYNSQFLPTVNAPPPPLPAPKIDPISDEEGKSQFDQMVKNIALSAEARKTIFKDATNFELEQLTILEDRYLMFNEHNLESETYFAEERKAIFDKEKIEKIQNQLEIASKIKEGFSNVTSEYANNLSQRKENQIKNLKDSTAYEKATNEERKTMEKDVKKQFAKEEKRLFIMKKISKLGEITINTASAVAEALPNIPLSVGVGVLGAIQAGIALAVPAPKYERGGMIGGQRHSQGGTMIEAERGEFIMSRSAVQSVGVEALNQMNQGGGGGLTLNISAPLVDETIIDTIIPAIQKAQRMNLA